MRAQPFDARMIRDYEVAQHVVLHRTVPSPGIRGSRGHILSEVLSKAYRIHARYPLIRG